MPDSLIQLEQQRSAIFEEMLQLPDFRSGSISPTSGRCGGEAQAAPPPFESVFLVQGS